MQSEKISHHGLPHQIIRWRTTHPGRNFHPQPRQLRRFPIVQDGLQGMEKYSRQDRKSKQIFIQREEIRLPLDHKGPWTTKIHRDRRRKCGSSIFRLRQPVDYHPIQGTNDLLSRGQLG